MREIVDVLRIGNMKYKRLFISLILVVAVFVTFVADSATIFAKTSSKLNSPLGVMATAVETRIAVTYEKVDGADEYWIYEAKGQPEKFKCVKKTKKDKIVFRNREKGETYFYYVRAVKLKRNKVLYKSKPSKKVSTTVSIKGKSTIKNFLQTALAPVGSTLYIWGGGWNKADTGTGIDAKHVGLSSRWREFYNSQNSDYNYKNYRYKIRLGLDCSGYVGWCVYNILNTTSGRKGYVMGANSQAKSFADEGMGKFIPMKSVKNYKAGDIMSANCECCGHVWIVIGECDDGSVVLVHSSPQGVSICGTVTPSGDDDSKAIALAKKYMKKYYRNWHERYPRVSCNASYLSHYGQMRWKTTGRKVTLTDPDGYQNMSAEEVLKDLFGEN